MGRITPGKPLKGIPAQDWNRFCETADRVLSAPPGGNGPGPGRVPGSLRVMVKNTTGTPIDAHGVLKLGDPLINPTDRAGVVLEEPVFAGTTPSDSDDLHDIAIVPACDANGFAKAFVEGYTWATVNVTDAGHGFAKPQASVVQLVSHAEEGFPIKWKPSGTGSKKCLIRMMTSAEPGETVTAKIVKLSQIIKPAYEEEDTGVYTHFAPVANAATYSHDDITGELTLNEDSLSVVNLAQRSYGTDGAARAEYVLAVPIDGGKRVLVPMANDPYVNMVSLEYRNTGSTDLVLTATAEHVNDTAWIQQDKFTPLSFGRVPPADSDESFPLYARAHETGLYICKPGKYLIIAGVKFTMGDGTTSYGAAKLLTTGAASAGTAHTHDIEADGPWGQLAMQVRGNLIDAATPSATPFYPDAFAHVNLPVMYANETSGDLELITSFVIAASPGFITRYNLMAAFQAWNFDDEEDLPKVRLTGGYIRAIPVSDYIHGQSIPTDDLHTKQYNPYASGSFVWHEGFSAPPEWDKDGAAV